MKKFDIAIIGAGPGGYTLASILAKNGKKVALFEKKHFGGTCVNEGCISTKTLIKSAKVLDTLKMSEKYGITSNNTSFNFGKIQQRRIYNKIKINNSIKNLLENSGVKIFFEEANVINSHTIETQSKKQIKFQKLVLATGSRSRELNLKGFETAKINNVLLDSINALELKEIPGSLIIIGGGPVSLEFAYFYSTFGTKVTILEARKFMNNFDQELQTSVRKYLENKNINVIENVNIIEYKDNKLITEIDNKIKEFQSDRILLAIGRVPNNDSFKLLNLKMNQKGFVEVNKYMQTSESHIYALGDLTGLMMLSSVAYKTADIIANHILENDNFEKLDTKTIPWAVYLNPEFAGIGYSEEELKRKNIEYDSIIIRSSQLPRAYADGANLDLEFLKFLVDKKTGLILGSSMFIDGASLIINQISQAMKKDIKFNDLEKISLTHPTISEAIYYASRNYYFSNKARK
ncbi:dihydrolipoyl dehydrogenase [Mycoplasma sp. CSL7491-lung]|uniref:dihydrolipoyl dehydrogenase n=1 Tax=Mycoplasma sp. CSL7491-lung TaxID=549718 RepID=UPI001C12533B|nr:dihydrolipoyl dehydrogenase [Mycoplasma sp. CSL7491-lung]MBU4692847.1 dihydrolipoyl dehydrogenase [Mycoplasma sp. CSL7491-lung]